MSDYEITPGEPVHYVAYNETHLAAIIIGVEPNGVVDLVAFTSMLNVNGKKNFGEQYHQSVAFDENNTIGTWHWRNHPKKKSQELSIVQPGVPVS